MSGGASMLVKEDMEEMEAFREFAGLLLLGRKRL